MLPIEKGNRMPNLTFCEAPFPTKNGTWIKWIIVFVLPNIVRDDSLHLFFPSPLFPWPPSLFVPRDACKNFSFSTSVWTQNSCCYHHYYHAVPAEKFSGWMVSRSRALCFPGNYKEKKKLFLVCYCALLPSLNKRFSDYNYKKTETEIRKEHREMLYTVTHPQTHTRHE